MRKRKYWAEELSVISSKLPFSLIIKIIVCFEMTPTAMTAFYRMTKLSDILLGEIKADVNEKDENVS